jgi:hypothetical protein
MVHEHGGPFAADIRFEDMEAIPGLCNPGPDLGLARIHTRPQR